MPEIAELFQDEGKPLDVRDDDGSLLLTIRYNVRRLPAGWRLPGDDDPNGQGEALMAFTRAVVVWWDVKDHGVMVPIHSPAVPAGVFLPIYSAVRKDIRPNAPGSTLSAATSSTNATSPAVASGAPTIVSPTSTKTRSAISSSRPSGRTSRAPTTRRVAI
jgi:hypothetical protein